MLRVPRAFRNLAEGAEDPALIIAAHAGLKLR